MLTRIFVMYVCLQVLYNSNPPLQWWMSCSSKKVLFMFCNKPAPTLKKFVPSPWWRFLRTEIRFPPQQLNLRNSKVWCEFRIVVLSLLLLLWLHTALYKTAKNVSSLFYLDSIWLMNLSKLKQSADAGMKAWALAEVTIRNVTNITTDKTPKWANLKNGSFGLRVRVSDCRQQ